MRAIIIVGAARSGTKMLGNLFSMHPDVTYFGEVNQMWRTGNESVPHDILPINEESVTAIRQKFKDNYKDGTVLVEKTAANSLRLPLVSKVFEEVKYIHIVRDGRDVALSASQKWRGQNSKFEREALNYGDSKKSIVNRLLHRLKEASFKEILYLIPKGFQLLLSFIGWKKESTWGPSIPGLKDYRKTHSLIETCAYQWRVSESFINSYFTNHPEEDVLHVRYEDLCQSPEKYLREFMEFADMDIPDNIKEINSSIKMGNLHKWKSGLSNKEIEKIQDICADILVENNYDLYKN